MTQRRVLPPRVNRGKRPQASQEQKARDDIIYNHIFQRAAIEQKYQQKRSSQKEKMQSNTDSMNFQTQRRQTYGVNRIYFPYPRSYHYYFQLQKFPRLENSVSYAIDQTNVFNSTYSQQNVKIKDDLTVGMLFNRKFIGLPIHDVSHIGIRSRDKNICHFYLFQNQDRKFQIDKSIYELKLILKNFDKLNQNNQLLRFSCLKRDIDLIALLQEQVTVEQKKSILKKKIRILQEKKQSMKQFLMMQDRNFFSHSLNQRLHDQIQQQGNQLTLEYIMNQIQYSNTLRQKFQKCEQKYKLNFLSAMFLFCNSKRLCIKQSTVENIVKKIRTNFFTKQQADPDIYQISVPFVFFNFSNQKLMTVSQKIMALRLLNCSEASFFVSKIFWKRIFNKELIINKQSKSITRVQYDKSMNTLLNQIQKWKRQQESRQKSRDQTQNYPLIDDMIDWNVFQTGAKSFDLFKIRNQGQNYLHVTQITARQYACIMLFYHLYLSVASIYEFILNNEILGQLIAMSQYFAKSCHYLTQALGNVRVGLIQEILKKLTDNIVRQNFETNFRLKWVYNEQAGVAYIVKLSAQSQWQTQKQQQQEQQQDENLKQVVDQKPKKRILE